MTPWKVGDPVGNGVAFLPDSKSKREYSGACEASMIDAAARYAVNLQTLRERRNFIERVPASRREAVKASVAVLWGKRS